MKRRLKMGYKKYWCDEGVTEAGRPVCESCTDIYDLLVKESCIDGNAASTCQQT